MRTRPVTIPLAWSLCVIAGFGLPGTPSLMAAPQVAPLTIDSQSHTTSTIQQWVQLGLSQNPRIQEASFRIQALRHRLPQVRALPDPMVSTTTYLAPVQTAAGEQRFAMGINQKWVSRERRETQAEILCSEIQSAEAELQAVQLEVAQQIKTACYQLLWIRKAIQITEEDAAQLGLLADVIEQQYQVKQEVSQQDLLNIQVEQSNVENQLTEWKQKEKSYQARLARLVHQNDPHGFALEDSLAIPDTVFDVDQLVAQALQDRPELQSQWSRIQANRGRIQLAELESRPDFTVGLNWVATSTSGISPVANGDDAVMLGVSWNLPVNRQRIQAAVNEAQANHWSSESRLASLQDQAAEEIFDLVAKLDSTRSTLQLIQEDILPKSQRSLELSIDQYSTGTLPYVQLIDNWRTVLRYRTAQANLQSQYLQLLAALGRSVGQWDLEFHQAPTVENR